MHYTDIKRSGHNWEKQNLVTVSKDGKHYDEMLCANCGMKGKRFDFDTVAVDGRLSRLNAHRCKNATEKTEPVPQRVRVTRCIGVGPVFGNLTPGSTHDVVEPPHGYANDHTGVWVMGVDEPVKLLRGEYVFLTTEQK